jgi:hypothetical protein
MFAIHIEDNRSANVKKPQLPFDFSKLWPDLLTGSYPCSEREVEIGLSVIGEFLAQCQLLLNSQGNDLLRG